MNETAPKKRSTFWHWLFIILLLLALGFSIFMNVGMGVLLFSGESLEESDQPVDEFPEFEEEWSYGTGDVKVVRMALNGVITRQGETSWLEGPFDMVEDLILSIRAARNDEDVKAIIMEVDSPGGGITPSDEIYTELKRFRDSAADRRVIIYMRDLTASGGYYVAMAGDWLVAQPTTIIGSIGVIMQTLNWKVLSDKIGVTDTTIKSGENKDMLNPFRDSDPEEIAMLQTMIDTMHERFQGIVADSRGIERAALKDIADGRIFTSDQALELKLIDGIGYWEDVVEKTSELLGVPSVRIVRYYQSESFWDTLTRIKHPLTGPLARLNEGPSFQYRWKP